MAVSVLHVDAHDLGAIPPQFIEDNLPSEEGVSQVEYDPEQSQYAIARIKLGTNNQYHIDEQLIKTNSHCQVYDNQTKILEWNLDEDGTLVVQSYTEKQINLLASLKVKKCSINATGPLVLNGALDAESITIDADALWFSAPLRAEDSIDLNARQGVGFFAPVKANNLVVNAAYVHQEAELQISGLWDVATQFFKQNAAVKTSVNVLRLAAVQCEMKGELTIHNKCFLVATTLVWGDESAQTTFRLLGESYIRVDSLHLKGDTQACIQNPELNQIDKLAIKDIEKLILEQKNVFAVRKELIVDGQAAIAFTNSTCFIESLHNEGQLSFDGAILKAQHIKQDGIVDFTKSGLLVAGEFSQRKSAITELDNCIFHTPKTNVYGGELNMTQCFYVGDECSVYKGALTLKKESHVELKDIFVDLKAQAEVNNCQVKARTSIVAYGALCFDRASITTSYLKTWNGAFHSKNSKVAVDVTVQLSGITDLNESEFLVTKGMTITGALSINKAQLNAELLEIKSQKALIYSLRSTTRALRLHGSTLSDQVIFQDAALTTQIMSCIDHVTMESSVIYGIPDKKITHDLRARLKLNNSKFITENDIRNHLNGTVELDDKSFLKARLFHSQGAMKAKDSKVFCHTLLQDGANAEFIESDIQIEQRLAARAGKIELKGATLTTSIAELLDKSALILEDGEKESILTAQSALLNDYNSTVTSLNSKLAVKKFKSLGHTELCSSVLSANELEIHSQFAASSQTSIAVDEVITVAAKAHARLDNTVVEAKKGIKTAYSSTVTLKGYTKVQTETMRVGGALEVQATPGQPKAKPQVAVNKDLYMAEKATVKGDGDLEVDADELVHAGTLNLSGKLKATGRVLTNHGSMSAEDIYLGFDDNVHNLGMFSAEEMVVHGSLQNQGGQIYARKSLRTAGVYSFNLGLIAANNYVDSSLFSFNVGLIAPNFSADRQYIFTWDNGVSLAKIAARTFFPDYTNIINVANFLSQIKSYKKNGIALYEMAKEFNIARYKTMRRHELIAELCQFKGYVSSVYSAFNTVYSTCGKLSDLGDEVKSMKVKIFDVDTYSKDNCNSLFSRVDYLKFSKSSAGVFLGNYTQNSLVSVNLGGSFAIDTSKSSLLAFNGGLEASLLSHTIQSEVFFNSGWSGGTDASFDTRYADNMGTIEGLYQLTFNAEKAINKGTIDGTNAHVAIHQLSQDGTLALHKGQAKIDEFKDTDEASTTFTDMLVTGTNFDANAHLQAESTAFVYADKFEIQESAQASLQQVVIKAHEFNQAGHIDFEKSLSIEADKGKLKKGAVINGKKTDEEELYVTKTTDDSKAVAEQMPPATEEQSADPSATPPEPEKEFQPKHILQLKIAERLELNGTLQGGDYVQIQGKRSETTEPSSDDASESSEEKEKPTPKCEEIIIGDDAAINIDHGSIDAKHVANSGKVELSKVAVAIDDLTQSKQMKLDGCFGTIGSFKDTESARTEFKASSIEGTTFTSVGHSDLQSTRLKYSDKVDFKRSAQTTTDNVEIIAGTFEHEGKLEYQNSLVIHASHADLKKGSSIVGKQTSDDELFVPKVKEGAGEGQTTGEQSTSETATEVEKEFKPQHILTLEANTGALDGELRGGDYTTIKGISADQSSETAASSELPVAKCESLSIGESAGIDLRYGSISSKHLDTSSKVHLQSFSLDVDKTDLKQNGVLALKDSVFKGDELQSSGLLTLDGSVATFNKKVELSTSARETLKDSRIVTSQFVDKSQMSYQGEAGIFADHYEHSGKITKLGVPTGDADKGLFYVKAKTAHLTGSADVDNGLFDFEHFADASQFVAGRGLYSSYKASKSFELDTQDYVTLNSAMARDCDVTVKASGLTMAVDYNKARALNLISTVGDVNLLSNVCADSMYVKSARDIRMNHQLYTNGVAQFEADGSFYNQGGVINAQTVGIKAKTISNISAGSYAATSAGGVPMGSAGIINGRKDVFLEATAGDIANYGGMIRSGNYTQLLASGNVYNVCNVRTTQGAYSVITSFDGGLIAGGSGSDTDGVGLYIKAGGKVIADASNFVSNGSNYIEGDLGIELLARQETHISDYTKKKTWYGKSSRTIKTQTTVTGSTVQSGSGVNILKSGHGGVKSVATNFISPGGTQIAARDDVALYSLKTQNRKHTSSSSLWGLSKHSTSKRHEESVSTLFFDNGVTRIRSEQGSIDARGAYFCGNGDLEMHAKGRIKFGADILNHEIVEKSRSLGVSVPGMGAWNAWKSSGSLKSALTAEDATLAKLDAMLHSGNTSELFANSANLGINLYNTTSSLARGFANDTLRDEMLSRYGLGGADGEGFVPIFTLSMSESKTRTRYQTQGVGGVNRGGNVFLEAGEGIDLEDGVRVHAGGNMVVDAPEVIATAAALHSSLEQTTKTQSVGVSPTGHIQDAALGYSHTSTTATQFLNAELSADGNMKLGYQNGAMHQLTLDGAVIKANSMDAAIEHLQIIDKQDLSTTKTESFSGSLSGQVSAYKGQGDSATVKEHSGILIKDNAGHAVTIDEAHMTGGAIQTSGGSLVIDKLVTQQVKDHSTYSGVGLSFNVHDLQRLAGQEATNQTGEQAIAIAELKFDKVDYQAEHTAVVYGDKDAHIEIKEVVGQVHTESADGTKVLKDDELHLTLDIPLTNHSYIEQSADNLQKGMEKLSEALGLKEPPKTELPPIPEDPVLPSRRDEEEEEEEEEVGEKPADESGPDLDKQKEKELNPEEVQAALQEIFKALPEEKKEKVQQAVEKAKIESGTKQGLSSETAKDLKKQLLSAINQVMKAGSEEMWGKLVKAVGKDSTETIFKMFSSPDALSKLNTKLYLGAKGTIGISFMFNLFGASIDGDKDVWNRAVKNTAGDLTLNFVIKTVAGELSGPIGWGFVGIGVLDTFFYDEKIVKMYVESGSKWSAIGCSQLAQGHIFTSVAMLQLAQANAQIAANLKIMHAIANTNMHIGDGLSDVGDKIRAKDVAPAPKSSSIVNRNLFFKPAPSETEESQKATNVDSEREELCASIT